MKKGTPSKTGKKPVSLDEVPPKLRRILAAVPIRNEDFLKWERDPTGLVTITHAKNLGNWERRAMKLFGGSPVIKRKLDAPASDIWVLCDGEHTIAGICDMMDQKYREKMEPVLTRVVEFMQMLLARNLVYFKGSAADLARIARDGGTVKKRRRAQVNSKTEQA